jgi:hypothetical protein
VFLGQVWISLEAFNVFSWEICVKEGNLWSPSWEAGVYLSVKVSIFYCSLGSFPLTSEELGWFLSEDWWLNGCSVGVVGRAAGFSFGFGDFLWSCEELKSQISSLRFLFPGRIWWALGRRASFLQSCSSLGWFWVVGDLFSISDTNTCDPLFGGFEVQGVLFWSWILVIWSRSV